MKITNVKYLLLIFGLSTFTLNGQADEKSFQDSISIMIKSTCRLYVHQTYEGKTETKVGTGINIRESINNKLTLFVFTADHIIEGLFKLKNSKLQIYFSDLDNNIYSTDSLDFKNVIWHDSGMDAAILVIPELLYHKTFPDNYNPPVIPSLEKIEKGFTGEDVYMLGRRWLTGKNNIPIFKKGIVSTITKNFPRFEGHIIYIIDKMANKGMSGGLIFNRDFQGIALISGYILEKEKKIQTSDDLTVGISLNMMFTKLKALIDEHGESLIQ